MTRAQKRQEIRFNKDQNIKNSIIKNLIKHNHKTEIIYSIMKNYNKYLELDIITNPILNS